MMIRIIAPAMIAGVNALKGLGRDDVDNEEHTLLRRFVADWLTTTLGDIYILSNILKGAITQIVEGREGFGMTDPLTAHWARMSLFVNDLMQLLLLNIGITKVKNRRDWEKKKDRIVKNLVFGTSDLVSKGTGLPFESTRRSLELIGKGTGILEKKEDTKKRKRHIF